MSNPPQAAQDDKQLTEQLPLNFEAKLDTTGAAEYLGLAPPTLETWRANGKQGQPPFYKVGRKVFYLQRDLDQWLTGNRQVV